MVQGRKQEDGEKDTGREQEADGRGLHTLQVLAPDWFSHIQASVFSCLLCWGTHSLTGQAPRMEFLPV